MSADIGEPGHETQGWTHAVCSLCGQRLPIAEFSPRTQRTKRVVHSRCKQCRNNDERERRARNRVRIAANNRRSRLRRLFGLSEIDYIAFVNSQDGVCAICQQDCFTGRRLAVDHDHTTGVVRGLLCAHCNRAIGLFRDDPLLLRRALDYLEGNMAWQ